MEDINSKELTIGCCTSQVSEYICFKVNLPTANNIILQQKRKHFLRLNADITVGFPQTILPSLAIKHDVR